MVTGSTGAIGAATCRSLVRAGFEVVGVDRFDPVEPPAWRHRTAQLDRVDEVTRAFTGLRPDVLVNNAGLQHVSPIEDFPTDRFALILRLMLQTPFELVRAALPSMYERGWGRLLHVSSVHGLRASPHKSAYVAAKHGLEGLSKVAALEGGGRGVTSNTICPGYVRTALVEGQIAAQAEVHGLAESEVVEKVMLTAPSIKRLIEPSEVAELAAYLCSDAASYANGSSFVLDGGWSAR